MPLIFLLGPSVPNPVGAVVKIVNAKQAGAQGMDWSFESMSGWYQAQRKYVNTLRVITNSQYVGPIQVQQAILGLGCVQGATYRFPLPELNNSDGGTPTTPTEIDTGSFAQSISIHQDQDDAKQWLVVISYSSYDINHEWGNSNVANGSINPLETAPEVHWTSAKYEAYYTMDVNGLPYRNTVGDPFDPVPPTEETRQVLSFVRNESEYNETWAQAYRDSVNSDTFLGYAPNQVKCKDIQGQRIYGPDYGYYWRVSYEFEFRVGYPLVPNNPDQGTTGWTTLILNAGLRQFPGGVGAKAQITLNGALVTSPVPLTQAGAVLPDGGTPYYLQFNQYSPMPFAFLNIPQNAFTTSQ